MMAFSSVSVISGCTVSSCSTSGSAFFLGICSSSCNNYFLAKKRCVPFSCRMAKMTGLVYGNVSGRMSSGSRTMIFSSCRISRSGGGSLPDTMTNCLKLGSPSEKRSRYVCPRHKKILRLRRGQLQHHVNGFYLLWLGCPPVCVTRPSEICSRPPICIWRTQAPVTRTGIVKRRKGKRLFAAVRQAAAAPRSRAFQHRQQIFLLFRQQHQPRPFPGGERSELRYGSTSRSLSVSVMQL